MKGKSHYLSQPTLEKIARTFDVAISEITGHVGFATGKAPAGLEFEEGHHFDEAAADSSPFPPQQTGLEIIRIVGSAMGPGLWGQSIFLPPEKEEFVSFHLPSLYAGKAFGIKMVGNSMDEVFASGTVLGCVTVENYLQKLVSGDIVIVVRRSPQLGLFETTVKRYVVEGRKHYLVSCTTDETLRERLDLAAPLSKPTALGHQDFFIHSVALYYAAKLPAAQR